MLASNFHQSQKMNNYHDVHCFRRQARQRVGGTSVSWKFFWGFFKFWGDTQRWDTSQLSWNHLVFRNFDKIPRWWDFFFQSSLAMLAQKKNHALLLFANFSHYILSLAVYLTHNQWKRVSKGGVFSWFKLRQAKIKTPVPGAFPENLLN